MDLNKRLVLALMLSFLVLFGLNYIFPQPKKVSDDINGSVDVKNSRTEPKSTPKVATGRVEESTPELSQNNKSNQQSGVNTLVDVETEKYRLKIDKLGRIYSAILKEKKYRDDEGKPLELINPARIRPLEIRFSNSLLNKKAFQVEYQSSSQKLDATGTKRTLTLTQNLGDVILKKILTFYPDGHYDIKVDVSREEEYFITTGHRPEGDKSLYLIVKGSLVRDTQGVITTFEDEDIKESVTFKSVNIVSSFDRYYSSLFFNFDRPFTVTVVPDSQESPVPFIKSSGNMELKAYIGPKEWKLFKSLDSRLIDAIEFGWFTFLAKPFFKVMLGIYEFVGNWGWAIVIFTILVKLLLFPLSYKGMMSMQKLKDLAPKMKEIKEKYKDDPAKMNIQMMELYKKHGANPMGGCLPMLLQIPVFFALYRVLLNADELQGASWIFWIDDLSRQDSLFVLPILMGATMFIQQLITPNTMTDPMQQKIFKWFPVIMTFFFLTFPAGLVLYWLTNNILSIAQQQYINFAYEKYKKQLKQK
jgi:YidC/Oxa1 family membrane protein insertase